MSNTALAAAGLIGFHLFMALMIFGPRGLSMIFRGRAPNTYSCDGRGEPDWAVRVIRAHANSYESFPFTVGPLLLALALNQTAVTDPWALAMLGARVAQGVVHIASTSVLAVLIRFTFFFVQWALAVYWLWAMFS